MLFRLIVQLILPSEICLQPDNPTQTKFQRVLNPWYVCSLMIQQAKLQRVLNPWYVCNLIIQQAKPQRVLNPWYVCSLIIQQAKPQRVLNPWYVCSLIIQQAKLQRVEPLSCLAVPSTCMPIPFTSDLIKVQQWVLCILWTNINCIALKFIFLSISSSN